MNGKETPLILNRKNPLILNLLKDGRIGNGEFRMSGIMGRDEGDGPPICGYSRPGGFTGGRAAMGGRPLVSRLRSGWLVGCSRARMLASVAALT